MTKVEEKLILRRKRLGAYEKQKVEASLEGFLQNVDSKEKAMMMLLWRIGDRIASFEQAYLIVNKLIDDNDVEDCI